MIYALLCKYTDNKIVKQYLNDNPMRCSILSIMDVNMYKKDYLHRALIADEIVSRKKVNETPEFTEERVEILENGLKALLGQIIDKDKSFTQTEDPKRCKFCDFKSLCGRM